jgi:hypothetical protein
MTCPRCGATILGGSTFCHRCRSRVSGAAPTSAPQPIALTPVASARPQGRNPAQGAALASLVAVGIVILLGMATKGLREETPAVTLVLAVGSMLILAAGAISGLVALAMGPRYGWRGVLGRAIAGLLLCSGLLSVYGYALVTGYRNARRNARAADHLAHVAETTKNRTEDLLKKASAGEDVAADGVASIEQLAAAFRRSGSEMSGTGGVHAQVAADALTRLSVAMRDKLSATRPLLEAGGNSPVGLDSRAAVRARLDLAIAAEAAHVRLVDTAKSVAGSFEQQLVARGVPKDQARSLAGAFARGFKLERFVEFQGTDLELLQASKAILSLLEAHFGRWSYDRAAEKIRFEDPAIANSYNAHIERLQAALRKQQQMQKAALETNRQAQPASTP